jgi:hypothetical protein
MVCNTVDEAEELSLCFPKLERLDLSKSQALGGLYVRWFIAYCEHLEELDISRCLDLTDKMLVDLLRVRFEIFRGSVRVLPSAQRIQRLNLSFCPQVTDRGIKALFQIKNVTHLAIVGTKVTARGLQQLWRLFPDLHVT